MGFGRASGTVRGGTVPGQFEDVSDDSNSDTSESDTEEEAASEPAARASSPMMLRPRYRDVRFRTPSPQQQASGGASATPSATAVMPAATVTAGRGRGRGAPRAQEQPPTGTPIVVVGLNLFQRDAVTHAAATRVIQQARDTAWGDTPAGLEGSVIEIRGVLNAAGVDGPLAEMLARSAFIGCELGIMRCPRRHLDEC